MTATPSNPAQRCQPSMAEPTRAELIAALKATYRNFMATGADRESDERYEDWVDTIKNLYAPPCATLKARVAELEGALRFYADPFAWKKLHDPEDVVRVPDFYSETSFGDTAEAALSHAGPVSRDGEQK
jgi:hypothetical protein